MSKSKSTRLFKKILTAVLSLCLTVSFAGCTANQQNKADDNEMTGNENKIMSTVKIKCGDNTLEMELANNSSATAFYERLEQGDITVKMNDYGGFEKVGALGFDLPRNDEKIITQPGDVILYLGNQITIYYGMNSWDFTRIGKIKNMTKGKMLEFFGGEGEVSITFTLDKE